MPPRNILLKRLGYSLLFGLLMGLLINEVPFLFLREKARGPQEVLLTVPAGTAELVAKGEQPPAIPANMIFVVGDTLVVKNEDNVDHKLGPLWIPANSSAQLVLEEKESFNYECSFQPDKIFGLDVQEPLTLTTRILSILNIGISMAVLFGLYSIVMPVKKHVSA